MIYNRMLKEKKRLEKEIISLDEQLKALPSGDLFFSHSGSYLKWYQSNGHSQTYISKKNRHFAEQLARKKYLSLLRKELLHEKEAIDLYLNHHNAEHSCAEQLLAKDSDYQEFLLPYFTPISQELSDWMQSPYEHNPHYPEQLIQATTSGHFVRSKSEALIDMVLHKNKIPFRYEAALRLGDTTFYPDFTIRHPYTGETYYWEHFGMMDIPNYSKKAYSKLQYYSSFGIIPDIQLITTYETKDTPINPELVEKIVEHYFL